MLVNRDETKLIINKLTYICWKNLMTWCNEKHPQFNL